MKAKRCKDCEHPFLKDDENTGTKVMLCIDKHYVTPMKSYYRICYLVKADDCSDYKRKRWKFGRPK